MKRKTDWVDHVLGLFALAFVFFCVMVVKEAKSHHDNKPEPYVPEEWTGPDIPQCDRELWDRITEGCPDE